MELNNKIELGFNQAELFREKDNIELNIKLSAETCEDKNRLIISRIIAGVNIMEVLGRHRPTKVYVSNKITEFKPIENLCGVKVEIVDIPERYICIEDELVENNTNKYLTFIVEQ